jgi:hypothetical protein
LWRDKDALAAGEHWKVKLKEAVAESAFFMQMVSPSAVKSPFCRFELDSFMEREKELGRDDLIFPILYISVPELDDKRKDDDPVLSVISEREYVDWRKIRHAPVNSPEVRQTVEQFCNTIAKKLRQPRLSPEDRKRLEEDDAAQERQTGGRGHEGGIRGNRKSESRSIFSRFPLSLLPSRQWLTRRKLAVCGLILALVTYLLFNVADWLSIRNSTSAEDFQHHLATYPLSPFRFRAQDRLAVINDWLAIKDSMDRADYERYLTMYPSSPFASFALGRLTGEKDTLLRALTIEELQHYIKKYPESLYRRFADLRLSRLQTVTSNNFTPVLLPESSRRLIRPEEIQSLGCKPLWRARNEIYYAVGYCFSSQNAISAFKQTAAECHYDNCKVFNYLKRLAEDVLSNTEIDNVSTFKRREKEIDCLFPEEIKGICTQ